MMIFQKIPCMFFFGEIATNQNSPLLLSKESDMASLRQLCAEKLVADPTWLQSRDDLSLLKLPEPLLKFLVELAAQGNKVQALLGLVGNWPLATLNLRRIVIGEHVVKLVVREVQKRLPDLECLDLRGCSESISVDMSGAVLRLIEGDEVLEEVRQMRVVDTRR